jgi:hypothetical protein
VNYPYLKEVVFFHNNDIKKIEKCGGYYFSVNFDNESSEMPRHSKPISGSHTGTHSLSFDLIMIPSLQVGYNSSPSLVQLPEQQA